MWKGTIGKQARREGLRFGVQNIFLMGQDFSLYFIFNKHSYYLLNNNFLQQQQTTKTPTTKFRGAQKDVEGTVPECPSVAIGPVERVQPERLQLLQNIV